MFLGVLHSLRKKPEKSDYTKGGAFMAKNNAKSKKYEGKGWKKSGKGFRYWKDDRIGCHDIVSIFQGDNEAFGRVVERYEPYALACARGIAADYHGIKNLREYEYDLVQDMWEPLREKILEKFMFTNDIRETENCFDSFVKSTIRKIMLNYMKKLAVMFNHEIPADASTIENHMSAENSSEDDDGYDIKIWASEIVIKDKRLADLLANGLGELKDRHRIALELAYVDDMPHEAIAKIMKLNKRSVDNYLSEAIRILKSFRKDDKK